MPEFQRKLVPFQHRGMNWNSPVEKLQDGQVCWAKNIRVLQQQGTVSSAHGHTEAFTIPAVNYVHTMSRLNVFPGDPRPSDSPQFDQNLSRTHVVGGDRALYVFQIQDHLNPAHVPPLNPVITPNGERFNSFSGNPLSIVDAQPAGAAVAWKYIGDSLQMCSVGYYPGDAAGNQMARALTMGMTPPINTIGPAPEPGVGSTMNGDYQWMFAYRNTQTGARSNPSAASRVNQAKPALTVNGTAIGFDLPEVPNDPITGMPDHEHIKVDVYRFGGSIFRWALVGSGDGKSHFVDAMADLDLLAAPAPPQATDPITGLTRFNLFRPFVTQDQAHSGMLRATEPFLDPATGQLNGIWRLDWTAGDKFDVNWLPGSVIYVNQKAFTIYQVHSDIELEIQEDAGKDGTLLPDHSYPWSVNAGILRAGQPLPHLWGPYGIGQSGSYIFACGDPNGRGTLYWTNGNDPDSTDVVNSIIVTSPSEKLMTGCVFDGNPYVWSTERQFLISPSMSIPGQFYTQEIAGAKGVWMEWSLSVQNNGFADQSVTWRGKDGIYDWSGAGLQRLSDPLYSFFPHDNNPGIAPETIMPFIGPDATPAKYQQVEHVGNLDDQQPQYHRTSWFHGLLFYDFIAQVPQLGSTPSAPIPAFSTLVWDSVNVGGWVSLDQPFGTTQRPVARGVEIGSNDIRFDTTLEPGLDFVYGPMARGGNMQVSWGNVIYDYYGFKRDNFQSRFITRAEDLGDSRVQKLWGDYWFDGTAYAAFSIFPLVNFHSVILAPSTVSQPAPQVRQQTVLDFQEFRDAGGKGLLSPTLGLDIRWIANDGQFAASINQWQPSFVVKPEHIDFRATDRSDEGAVQAKYLMGANIEADTRQPAPNLSVQPIPIKVIIDGNTIATLTLEHDGQLIKPYAWEPVAGYEFQVQFQLPADAPIQPLWQLYKVNWIFEPWPDAVARKYPFTSLGETGAKFIQGIVLPMETGGQQATVGVWFDDSNQIETWTKSTLPLKKEGIVLDMPEPIVAHFIQFETLTPHRIWPTEAKVIWEPIPELTNTWQTQETDHDMGGWSWHRDCFIAYMGNGDAPVFAITDEYGTITYTLDAAGPNQFVRCYRVLQPQKAKWHSYRITSASGVRLYQKDTVVRVKEWGSTGPFVNTQPFGDQSRISGARI